ncbi:zinc-dependent alcohol dehydrogenase [Ammoniphilus resinae]|uniref:2-desacetyl-2-hydroxyethyl bacteriochlorophyllide A dehydrogenase n=1 Tax=Ammoniphilus resinae TaxID=861532 RepID=A0ABS4GPG6_9BACL|nr:alcohol dehydrogenase catalytic domain-containing protein [Ammoniphilus resinae]MBP1931750.1 2-desacetyl-2-hydroxyethyl bacteriochlorophyllide A dehydrogenase [Ammoniphilus resinae]
MEQMRAGLFLGEKHVDVQLIDRPVPKEGEVLLRVSHAGICGSDMMIYYGKHPRAKAPLAMGHEFCGVIEEVNGDIPFQVGERVVVEPTLSCGTCDACTAGQYHVCRTLRLIGIDCNGGFAEFVAVPYHRLHRISEELSNAHAALTEPLAVAVHTVRRSGVKVGDLVVILGGGPIGLLVGLIAREAGASKIVVSDISPFRLQKAKDLGFTAVDAKVDNITDVVAKMTNGVGADVVFEVAGTQITAQQMVEAIKTQGQICVVSMYKQSPTINLASMHFRELSLTTTRCYSRKDFQTAIEFMASGKVDVSPLISHELELDQLADGFKYMENPEEALKILIKP